MNKPPICPKCGAHLPEDAPAGLCPNCLVRAGFESAGQAKPQIAPTAPSPASSRFEPPSVEELAGRFPQLEILELLGIGGMGAVYKARQKELDRLVAVKILPPELGADAAFAERFTREARALARLSHPNIVAVHDFGRTGDGLFFFVMEYIDGVNLRQAIQSGGMSLKEALAIVPQVCDALQFAHDEGIVHRDIKPENILVDKRGRVKIADFGLAKLLGQAPGDVALTATQQVMGTFRYMAPEQMEGNKAVDHRADIYSLGVVFYELLTGELPIGRFAPPSKKVQIDVRLDEVVLRALEQEPEQRYQHASEVKTEVEQIASTHRTKGSQHDPTDLRAARWLRRWLAGCSGWATIGSLLGAGAIFLPWGWVSILGITIFAFGYERWYGLVSGAVFLAVFLLLVIAEYLQASRSWRTLAMIAGGAVVTAVTSSFLWAEAFGRVAVTPGPGDTAANIAFGNFVRDTTHEGASVGPFVALALGLGLLVLGCVSLGGIIRRTRENCDIEEGHKPTSDAPGNAPIGATVSRATAPATAQRYTRLLLDETDRSARKYQHFLLIGGFAWILLGLAVVVLMPGLVPVAIALWIGGVAAMVAAGRVRQQWEIDYLGHTVRFENSVYTSGRLTIDGKTMASGGVGFRTELSARIPRGTGAGDRIVVKTGAGFLSFRCRLFVEPGASAPASV